MENCVIKTIIFERKNRLTEIRLATEKSITPYFLNLFKYSFLSEKLDKLTEKDFTRQPSLVEIRASQSQSLHLAIKLLEFHAFLEAAR